MRIEDVDFERCKPDYAVSILTDLENLGLYSDGEILFQSKRTDIYDEYLAHLSNITYHCTCSRKELSALSIPAVSFYDVNIKDLHLAPIYPDYACTKT